MDNILEVNNVVKQYANHLALDHVSLAIPRGSAYGLLGPNGAGKTTLIRIINNITAPDSGEVLLNGKKLTAAAVRDIGYLPEERGLYKKMKVGEQAIYLARLKGMSKADAMQSIGEWFEKFGIESWWYKKVEELSKGMAQKVQFISTVIHKPSLLIFDEPFSGFDPVNTELMKKEILALKEQGATIIFSTHNMNSVEELCENISLVNCSKIVLQGAVSTIKREHATAHIKITTKTPVSFDTTQVVSEKKGDNQVEYVVEKPQHESSNELIKSLLAQSELLSYETLLPTMNDIFIKTVNKGNHE